VEGDLIAFAVISDEISFIFTIAMRLSIDEPGSRTIYLAAY